MKRLFFAKTMAAFLADGYGGDIQVDIPHHFLDTCCATLRSLELPAYFPDSTSSSLMEERFL